MTVDVSAIPGLLLLGLELLVLAAVGFAVARVTLGQNDDRMALAQGMVIGLGLWGVIANFVMYMVPGLPGAVVAWVITLSLGAGLVWHAHNRLRLAPRTMVGFVAAALMLLWVALSSRQLISITDPDIHLGLSAVIRAGGWPPALPWNPEIPVYYHYGVDLLVGLLIPPAGLGPVFMIELLGAYVWTSFVLVIATTLVRLGGMRALTLTPLLLTAGAWTLVHYTDPPGLLRVPLPAGIPAAGLRASLGSVYWPSIETPEAVWNAPVQVSPPNIWQPLFVLAYALLFIVLTWAVSRKRRSWPAVLTLAALIGFAGLVEETVTLIVLVLWAVVEAVRLGQCWRSGSISRAVILRSAAGPGLALGLLVFGGGVITGVLAGSVGSGLTLGWIDDPASRRPVVDFTSLPGGIGVLEVGLIPVAIAAALLGRRDRLVLTLVAGSVACLLAALILQYEPARDVTRLDGHARNLALLALLLALARCQRAVRARWRYTVGALAMALIAWPTVIRPVHNIGYALSRGPQIAHASSGPPDALWSFLGRYELGSAPAERVADYIRTHTGINARILSPSPTGLSASTGRANAAGYAQFAHYSYEPGPEYLDAIRYLEPAAIHRRGFDYVHATDRWETGLPDRARRWLADRRFFEPLIRDGTDALYRVLPAFSNLESVPTLGSYEALRKAVPPGSTVYFSPSILPKDFERLAALRVAAALWNTQRLGVEPSSILHLQTRVPTAPLGISRPDFVITSSVLAPSALDQRFRQPVWWHGKLAAYSLREASKPIADAAKTAFSVGMADVKESEGHIAFSATFTDNLRHGWKGQDWLVLATDASQWAFPSRFESDGVRHAGAQWFAGQVLPGQGTTRHFYDFDPLSATLAVRGDGGEFEVTESSGAGLGPGVWTLAVRLRADWWEVALIPVMKIVVAEGGGVHYEVYEGELEARLLD